MCRVGSEAWKATRERPDSPDLILHIELGAPWGRGGLGRPVTGSVARTRLRGGVLHTRGMTSHTAYEKRRRDF